MPATELGHHTNLPFTDQEGLQHFNGSTTYAEDGSTFSLGNLTNFAGATGSGTRLLTNSSQKLGLYGVTPVVQPAGTAELIGVGAGNGATNANFANLNFNGNLGNTAYTVNDLVKALKQLGALAQ